MMAPGATARSLVDHRVLQRTRGAQHADVELTAGHSWTVTSHSGAEVARSDHWGGITIPVGGPYSVRRDGQLAARQVLVGDIWMLAGQSNMQGTARLIDVEDPSPEVNVLDMSRCWRMATEPLHQLSLSPDRVHSGFTEEEQAGYRMYDSLGTVGAGLGLSFGRAYCESTGVPVGLVATAHGGTSLAQWSPQLRDRGGDSLYGSWLQSLDAAGGRVAGVLWYQGESDAEPDTDFTFASDLAELVAAMRADAGDASLPFLHVQLGRVVADTTARHDRRWAAVREAQRTFGATAMASAIDLGLDDGIHINTAGLRRLGRRLAALAGGSATPVRVAKVEVLDEGMRLRVGYEGVNGRLVADGHVSGFSLHDGAGRRRSAIFHAAVDQNGDAVILHLTRALLPDDHLAYAYGCDPEVSLHDSADQAAPAFGPLRVQP
ncbi:MAG: sialate O-acetylesterase [Candidatus Dormibacteria bacterium]